MGFIKDLIKIVAGVAIGVGGLIAYQTYNPRDQVFDGKLGEWSVNYRESVDGNHLVAKKGQLIIRYFDVNQASRISFVIGDEPLVDEVDSIYYRDSKGRNVFVRSDIESGRFDAEAIKGVFESGDTNYNNFRTQIRNVRRGTDSDRLTEIKENIK